MSSVEPTVVKGHEGLRYPLTVVSIDLDVGSDVHKFQPAFTFKFTGTAIESQDDGRDLEVPRTFVETFDSPVDGSECHWYIAEGDTIPSSMTKLFSVVEPCIHELQYMGMCANCGKNLTGGDYLGSDTSRATVAMSHDSSGLTVSHSEAARFERETTRRLLQTSKLSLIVDLDQCIIQTTVDPTVGEWLRDEEDVNHVVLADVNQFRIAEEGPRGYVFYVKPRPYLQEFLASISKRYEMHIYTMGTKPYARKIASVIDPDGKYFGARILSRDESGSNIEKSIRRLFPLNTSMVVAMDDRGDIWRWSPNLIKVNPFEFFVGIGDINSSFLPKLDQKPLPVPKTESSATKPDIPPDPVVQGVPGAPAALVKDPVDEDDDPKLLAAQVDAQKAILEAQVEERPLAKQQEALVEKDDSGHPKRQSLLKNDDEELKYLEITLRTLHEKFYKMYTSHIGEGPKDRNLAKLNEKRPRKRSLCAAADVKSILSDMKHVVLRDVVITFSGLIPSNRDPRQEWQGQLAVQFGARVLGSRSKEIPTHVIVGKDITTTNLTEKAKLCKRFPWIKVVYLKWLTDCTAQFRRLDEQTYQVNRSAPHVPRPTEWARPSTEDGYSDTESIRTDNGETDRLINEKAKITDWTEMNAEMDEFLGDISDDATTDASDNDSDSSLTSTKSNLYNRTSSLGHKRMRSEGSGERNELLLQSPLSKRQNMARLRRSGLAHSTRADSLHDSPPPNDDDDDDDEDTKHGRTSPSRDASSRARQKEEEEEEEQQQQRGKSSEDSSESDLDDFANELELQLET